MLVIEDVEQADLPVRLPVLVDRGKECVRVIVSRDVSRHLDSQNVVWKVVEQRNHSGLLGVG
jgi:hypothetical protein